MIDKTKNIWPCTIVKDRYSGAYSKGKWTAWNLESGDVPLEIHEDDVTVMNFFNQQDPTLYGVGDSPEESLNDLTNKLKCYHDQ